MRAALLIPVKNLTNAKQRLSEALNKAQRSQLAEAMLRDVMSAAAGVTERLEVFLVTGDERAAAMAAEFNFGLIADTRNESETTPSKWRPLGVSASNTTPLLSCPATSR
jgi:2-phospho-L-lactate guanylyltransferase